MASLIQTEILKNKPGVERNLSASNVYLGNPASRFLIRVLFGNNKSPERILKRSYPASKQSVWALNEISYSGAAQIQISLTSLSE